MAAPQRNYPYNPQLAKALAFNRNDPQFNSVMSIYGSDGGHEGDVLPQALQPGAGANQVQQGPHVPNVAEVVEGVPAGQNAPSVEPALIAANTSAAAEQALAVGAPSSAGPSSATTASDATEEVVAQVNAHHETALLRVGRAGSQPEAGPSSGVSFRGHTTRAAHIPSPTDGSDTGHATSNTLQSSSSTTTTEGYTKSKRGRKGAATPVRPPRRSLRESALKTAQRLHELLVPRSRRGRKSIAAANSDAPSSSTIASTTSSTPPALQSAASTKNQESNKLSENETESKAGPSAKALGKRRRVEPETDDEDDDDERAPSEVEGASPAKKARRVRNLRNRSTPARFDTPKEEATTPTPLRATPKRKRASNDEDERSAGPSKRGRVANDQEARAPFLGPVLLSAAPRRAWSVEAQPSVVGVGVPPVVGTAGPPTGPVPQVHPPFIVVLPAAAPQAQQQPHPLPPPPPPQPLRRTLAKIFIRGG
ncbi:hypothetical protein FRC04_010302 [Tulasnella sp. 424]|nr:hypothetical protein FRC04_010302 [Tulasnella sp. 424]KAG8972684.1 hypothetical protein FRC05_009695 [Tulasnella sp. 425]